jgi:hypothetical protein
MLPARQRTVLDALAGLDLNVGIGDGLVVECGLSTEAGAGRSIAAKR